MINGIDAGASYRNRYTAGAFSTRETTGTPETEQTGGQSWDAVFTDKADNGVSVDDFLNLMVAQLQNQDFMNPVDDTQYVTQLAQFATMQQMQEHGHLHENQLRNVAGGKRSYRSSVQQFLVNCRRKPAGLKRSRW